MALERMDIDNCDDPLQVALHCHRYDFVLARLPAGQNVLEIGTGLGTFTKKLLPRCGSYVGVEFDPVACLEAQKKNHPAEIIEADARKLPFADNQFSFIVCLEVLEHLGDWQAGVKNIHRCLRTDGTAIISVPHRYSGGKSAANQFHLYEPGERELVSLLKQLFANVEIHYLYFEETLGMTIARIFHLRRLLGLDRIYADLSAGLPSATTRLCVSPRQKGMKISLLAVVSGKKSAS